MAKEKPKKIEDWEKEFDKLKVKDGFVLQCPTDLGANKRIEERSFGTTNSLGIETDINLVYTRGYNDGVRAAKQFVKTLLQEKEREIEKLNAIIKMKGEEISEIEIRTTTDMNDISQPTQGNLIVWIL